MKNIDEKKLLNEIRRINQLLNNNKNSFKSNSFYDVDYKETKNLYNINEAIYQTISLINYDRKNVLLESSSETNKIHKMANLLYPDEMYSLSSEGESLTNSGIFDGRSEEIGSPNNKKFREYAKKIATEKEWLTIFPYTMGKYYDPAYKRYPELYKKWKGHTAKEAEMSMLVNAWKPNITFKDFDIIDFSKTSDSSLLPGMSSADDVAASKKSTKELAKTKEDMRQKSVWENPEFVDNWMGKYDSEFYQMLFPATFYLRLAYEAGKKGYKYTPEWFQNWWENVATPFIQDYGWIPAVILGIGAIIASVCSAPVLAVALGVGAVVFDVLEIITYVQKGDPFMVGLLVIFLLIPGDAILRVVGGKKLVRRAANWLEEWVLGEGAKGSTKKMFKEAGEELFGPIIEIGTNAKLYAMAFKKMVRSSIVSLLSALRLKGLAKLIVWLIKKGYLLVRFLGKTVFTMGTMAITWGAICYYLGIKIPFFGEEPEGKLLETTPQFVDIYLKDLSDDNSEFKKEKYLNIESFDIKIIQLALTALGYDQILESDLSHLSYADKSYGIPKNDEERKKRCSIMFALGDLVGLKSDPSCKDYVGYFDPNKKSGIKLNPNFNISTKNTIKNIGKAQKDALGFNKDFGLKFDVQNKNLSTGLNYYEKPKATAGLNLGFTPGRIVPKLGYWDSQFDKMILVFQKRNNLKIEDNITTDFIKTLYSLFKQQLKNITIDYDLNKLKSEMTTAGQNEAESKFIGFTVEELEREIEKNETSNKEKRIEIYNFTISNIDNIPVEESERFQDSLKYYRDTLSNDDFLNTPFNIEINVDEGL